MEKIIDEIKEINKKKTITFSEDYYRSLDNKTIMGEVPFKEILFLDYRETEAGSNPREYAGLKKTNLKIIESLLEDKNMFRFLHSGFIVSLVTPTFIDKKSIRYENCCLTNGNQTRFIIFILTLLKLISKNGELIDMKKTEVRSFNKKYFEDDESVKNLIKRIKFNRIKEIINFLEKDEKYLKSFNKTDLKDFLNTRVRIQINLIDSIIEDLEDTDTYSVGTLIAEANNDTQNVKVDDIFGNRYRKELNKKIFKDFNNIYQDKVKIEFRLGEIVEKVNKVHILTLFRLVAATGILTKESDIFKFTNQRAPIYRLFEKLLKKDDTENTVSAISKLIPLLYEIRVEYVGPCLKECNRMFIRNYKEKAIAGDLENTIIRPEIEKLRNNDQELEKLIRRSIRYNIEHIMPVLVFRIREVLKEKDNAQLDLTISEENRSKFFEGLIEAIYEKYIEMKLGGLPTSLTTKVRNKNFYEYGREAYIAFRRTFGFQETNYITQNRYIIK